MAILSGCDTQPAKVDGIDLLGAFCGAQDPTYMLVWGPDAGNNKFINLLRGQLISTIDRDFTLSGSPDVLGSAIRGLRVTQTASVYDCVWEYSDFPIALIVEGSDVVTTSAACDTARFLDNEQLSALPV